MPSESSIDNSRKSKHGVKAQEVLHKTVEELRSLGAIADSKRNPHYGYEGFAADQFDAHEEITYPDETKAVLYATSTLRSDRVRKDQWRAHNTKRIDPEITYAYIVLPDESGYDQGTTPRDEIRDKSVVSAIDDIVTIREFYDRTLADYCEGLDNGTANDFLGRNLEMLFCTILNDRENLKRYNGSETETGYMYDVFRRVMRKIGVAPKSLTRVDASTNIPQLPNGGKPKTDVEATIELSSGEVLRPTFSLKNTSNKTVTVHEYTADAFADTLDPANAELRRLLNAFQRVGNKRDMDPADREDLAEELSPYLAKLNRWVFAGEGPEGTLPIQIAQYIVVRNKNTGKISIHTIDEYLIKQTAEINGANWFGTIFSWTYPSKRRGKRIQLKARIM